jgi:hypothetical protein
MKKLVSLLAVPATLLLAISVEASDKQLEVGISAYVLSAPHVVAQRQPALSAANNCSALAGEWRNVP